MVSLWSLNTSLGEAGSSEIFSSVARSYLYSSLSVVPLEEGGLVSIWRVKAGVPVKVGVVRGKGQ